MTPWFCSLASAEPLFTSAFSWHQGGDAESPTVRRRLLYDPPRAPLLSVVAISRRILCASTGLICRDVAPVRATLNAFAFFLLDVDCVYFSGDNERLLPETNPVRPGQAEPKDDGGERCSMTITEENVAWTIVC